MTKKEIIKAFEERKVRTVWDDKEEKWCQKKPLTICCQLTKAGMNDVYRTIDNDKYKSDI